MKKTEKKKKVQLHKSCHCVQCNEEIIFGCQSDYFTPVCSNPACPNYGLLQIGFEGMNDIEDRKERRK